MRGFENLVSDLLRRRKVDIMRKNVVITAILKVALMAVLAAMISVASFTAGFGTSWYLNRAQPQAVTPPGQGPEGFKVFWEAWDILEREFYGEMPDETARTYGAIRGVVNALGDENTVFLDPQIAELERADLQGQFEGIGAVVQMVEGHLTIVSPMQGQPAERAGLLPGDIVLKVDDTEIKGMTITEAVLLIRGPKGTSVRLTIERAGEPEPLIFDIVRDSIPLVTVMRAEVLEGDVGYVQLSLFAEPTTDELRAAIRDLRREGATSLILDLRNNPGGFLNTSIEVASQFLKQGVVVYQRWSDGREQAYRAQRGGVATDIPLAVLVNRGSASASEIVAGAIKSQGRGVLVGERTFGKGSVQNVHTLSDNSTLRVTAAQWLTPDHEQISKLGIEPDIPVPFTEEDIQAGVDPQLQRAIEYLKTGS